MYPETDGKKVWFMKTKVVYTNKAEKDLQVLGKEVAKRIIKKIGFYFQNEHPLKLAKKLNSPFGDLFRFRVGDYRVIFETDNHGNLIILTILTIKHRKDIYN